MGIPLYFRHIVKTVKGILVAPTAIDWLWIDFNCMIYHCIQRLGHMGREVDEEAILAEVRLYLERIVALAAPREGVYVAVDGPVPMAKMRQQRLRRFRGAMPPGGVGGGATPPGGAPPPWDKNAITPGTNFMAAVNALLHSMASTRPNWTVSDSDERGEGEHKLMTAMRQKFRDDARTAHAAHAVYGLDADLIVLSLLQGAAPIWLFREIVERGEIRRDADGNERFHWFSVGMLRRHLVDRYFHGRADRLRDYCFAMSLLGNDFVPSSMSLKMDSGHERLLGHISRLREPLIGPDGAPSLAGIRPLFYILAKEEEAALLQFIYKKQAQAAATQAAATQAAATRQEAKESTPPPHPPHSPHPPHPLPEAVLIDQTTGRLHKRWPYIYAASFLFGQENIQDAAQEYMRALAWAWSYYRDSASSTLSWEFFYRYPIAPPWSALAAYAASAPAWPAPEESTLRPVAAEQLVAVLPLQSWGLIESALGPSHPLTRACAALPHLWPRHAPLFTAGKFADWEHELELPIADIAAVRALWTPPA